MEQIQYELKTEIGPLFLVASQNGLNGVYFDQQDVPMVRQLGSKHQEKILSDVSRQIKEYFAGERKQFKIGFNLSGTAFQKKVWHELFKIPFGKTVSYKDIAQRIKNPKAVRAVGSANGKNPVCIIIPCHRVIAADGSIGGYSGGLDKKKKLLKMEGNRLGKLL